jgi:hypothetical protein
MLSNRAAAGRRLKNLLPRRGTATTALRDPDLRQARDPRAEYRACGGQILRSRLDSEQASGAAPARSG